MAYFVSITSFYSFLFCTPASVRKKKSTVLQGVGALKPERTAIILFSLFSLSCLKAFLKK